MSENFIELGADLEHTRWAKWQRYLHSLCVKNPDGSLTIPKERVERWERQINTQYSELPENEKEYDRIEVRKYLPLIFQEFTPKDKIILNKDKIVEIIKISELNCDARSWVCEAFINRDNTINYKKGEEHNERIVKELANTIVNTPGIIK